MSGNQNKTTVETIGKIRNEKPVDLTFLNENFYVVIQTALDSIDWDDTAIVRVDQTRQMLQQLKALSEPSNVVGKVKLPETVADAIAQGTSEVPQSVIEANIEAVEAAKSDRVDTSVVIVEDPEAPDGFTIPPDTYEQAGIPQGQRMS